MLVNFVLPYLRSRYADSIQAAKEAAREQLGNKTTFGESFTWAAQGILDVAFQDLDEKEAGAQMVGLGVFLLEALFQAGTQMALEEAELKDVKRVN